MTDSSETLNDILETMEAPEPVRVRARRLLDFYQALGYADCALFVSETVDDDGNRKFDSLWLLNDTSTMEGELTEAADDQLDGAPYANRLIRWATRSKDYNFVRAVTASRLTLELWFSDSIFGDLNASGPNCDRLRDLMIKYLLPETGAKVQAVPAARAAGQEES